MATWLLGPDPNPDLLSDLGLAVPDEALRSAREFSAWATGAREDWRERGQQALDYVARLTESAGVPAECQERAKLLIAEASRARLRYWAGQLFAAEGPVKTVEDLRAWCRLQQLVLSTLPKAYPVYLILVGSAPQLDEALLALARPFLRTSAGPEDLRGLGPLSRVTEDDDRPNDCYSFYAQVEARLNDEGVVIPTGPRTADYVRLTRYAWASARRLEQTVDRPLPKEPRPEQVRDADACRAWLDEIAESSQQRDSPTEPSSTGPQRHPDGPEPPRWLWWNNVRYEIPDRRAWELLNYMWDKEVMPINRVIQAIWRDPVQDGAVSTACSRLKAALPAGFPWCLGIKDRHRVIKKR